MSDAELLSKYLAGELTEAEHAAFARRRAASPALDAAARTWSAMPIDAEPSPGFEERVLRAVRMRAAEHGTPWWRLTLRRAAPLAAFASLVLAFALGVLAARTLPGSPSGTEFVFVHPHAESVALVGEFNGWDPERHVLRREGRVWRLSIELTPGVYQYQFVVDGEQWLADPAAAGTVDDGFGRVNSVVHIAAR